MARRWMSSNEALHAELEDHMRALGTRLDNVQHDLVFSFKVCARACGCWWMCARGGGGGRRRGGGGGGGGGK